MQSEQMWAGTAGQCSGAGKLSAEIPRQACSGEGLSREQMARSLAGDVVQCL